MGLRPGMKLVIQLLQPSPRDVSVDLRRRDVRMAEHQLDAAEIGAVLEEMGRKRVPEHVRRDVRADAGIARVTDDLHPERLPRHRPPPAREKQMRIAAKTLVL